MPGFDGTGPLGQGPLTGRGMGFCVVRLRDASPSPPAHGPARGSNGRSETFRENRKEVSDMPAGDGTGPLGLGPMSGRAAGFCAGYPVPGFMNPIPGGGFWAPPAYGWGVYPPAAVYGGRVPYGRPWGFPLGSFGRGFGRGWGRGFGRGRGRGRWWFGW
jgi:hypothetical protein